MKGTLTAQTLRDYDLNADMLYGGLVLYKLCADSCGVPTAREAVRHCRNAVARHPCERALKVLADLVTAVLDGEMTWEGAEQLIGALNWQQNGN